LLQTNHRSKTLAIKRWMGQVLHSIQKIRIRVAVNENVRSLSFVSWKQKKCLSAITGLAIAWAGFFGPAVLRANADDSFHVVPFVSMTRTVNGPAFGAIEESMKQRDDVFELETAFSEVVRIQNDNHYSPTLSGGDLDASKAQETSLMRAEKGEKSSRMVSHSSRVVAGAAATGGGLFLASKKFSSSQKEKQDDVVENGGDISQQFQDATTKKVTENVSLSRFDDPVHVKARIQPKAPDEEAELAARYAEISDVGERAFQILLDLGMIELTT
jgi:hypothetical protein